MGLPKQIRVFFFNFQSLFRSLVQTTSSAFGLPPIHNKFHYEHRNQCLNVSQSISNRSIQFCLCELRLRLEDLLLIKLFWRVGRLRILKLINSVYQLCGYCSIFIISIPCLLWGLACKLQSEILQIRICVVFFCIINITIPMNSLWSNTFQRYHPIPPNTPRNSIP